MSKSKSVITVEVVYCAKHQQFLSKLVVSAGVTIAQVIKLAQIQKHFMEVDFSNPALKVGIFSKLQALDYQVKDNERIEIYRELYQSPMQARKQRALNQKKAGK